MVGDRVIDQPAEMAEAAFAHFDALIGSTADHDCTLNLEHLINPAANLAELDQPFTDDEIWAAVKHLPERKAPGPDKFTAEFLLASGPWSSTTYWLSSSS
jgi:hypothetical protein